MWLRHALLDRCGLVADNVLDVFDTLPEPSDGENLEKGRALNSMFFRVFGLAVTVPTWYQESCTKAASKTACLVMA